MPTELVTNTTFDSDISNWSTVSGSPAYNSGGNGRLRLNAAAASASLSTVKNKKYRVQVRVMDTSSSGSSLKVQVGTSAAGTQNLKLVHKDKKEILVSWLARQKEKQHAWGRQDVQTSGRPDVQM